ncbi:MAG: hypothetical protein A2Z16_02540 [Chloroflexi bacterium RBG_16_54_18]|nr:MAG: hypothetical protein A2Z16_02540 [Chloroflexi bacterium RBG_16_54_18]
MKTPLRYLARPINLLWLVLLVAAIWALDYLPIKEIWSTLRGLDPLDLGLWLAFNLFILMVLCSRWWWIIRLQGYRLPFLRLAAYRLFGFSVSYFSPGTQFGGEPFQVYSLEKRESIPRGEALASVTLDKLFELLSNFTFLAVGTLFILNRDLSVSNLPASWMAALVVGLLVLPLVYMFLLWLGKHPLTWLAARLPAHLKKRSIRGSIQPLVTAAEVRISFLLRHKPLGMVGVFLLSGLIWALFIAEYWLMLSILGTNPGIKDAVSGLTAARLSFLTPIPGGFGALEASQVLAVKWMGLSTAVGISASLLIRARDVTLGLVGFAIGSVFSRSRIVDRSPSPYGDIT